MNAIKAIANEVRIRIFERSLLWLSNALTISNGFTLSGLKISLLRFIGIKISSPCFVDKGFNCLLPRNITIDKYCSFGHNNKIWAFNKVTIGPHVQTAIGVTMVSGGHDVASYDFLGADQDIVLEGENWIGANVTIIGGVRIGKGAIIAAGAVVTSNIPPYTVAGGVPAKVIRQRTPSDMVASPFGYYKPALFSNP